MYLQHSKTKGKDDFSFDIQTDSAKTDYIEGPIAPISWKDNPKLPGRDMYFKKAQEIPELYNWIGF